MTSRTLSTVPCDLLGSPPLVFRLVHRPHGAFNILHAHKTLVQAQVVAHCVLIQRQIRARGDVTELHESSVTHTPGITELIIYGCDTFQVAALRLK